MQYLSSVNWIPCSRRAKRFVSLDCAPKSLKHKLKSSLKFYSSSEHCVEVYADDDAMLISDSLEAHVSILQQVNRKPLTRIYLLSLLNVSPICLMAIVIEKKVFSSLQATKSITEGIPE